MRYLCPSLYFCWYCKDDWNSSEGNSLYCHRILCALFFTQMTPLWYSFLLDVWTSHENFVYCLVMCDGGYSPWLGASLVMGDYNPNIVLLTMFSVAESTIPTLTCNWCPRIVLSTTTYDKSNLIVHSFPFTIHSTMLNPILSDDILVVLETSRFLRINEGFFLPD